MVLDDSVRIRVLLHASGLIPELPVDEPARLIENVWSARKLEEPLAVVAVSIELNVHILLILTADRFRHLFYRRTTIDRGAFLASFYV